MTVMRDGDAVTVVDRDRDKVTLRSWRSDFAALTAVDRNNDSVIRIDMDADDIRAFVHFLAPLIGEEAPPAVAPVAVLPELDGVIRRLKVAREVMRVLGDYSSSEELLDYILTGNAEA